MNKNITEHFTWGEAACHDGTAVPPEYFANVQALARRLEVIRHFFNVPITIHSWYRTVTHNKMVGGKLHSEHLTASAADFEVKNVKPVEVQRALEGLIRVGAIPDGGLEAYSTFTHYDIGAARRWDGGFNE